MKKCVVSTVEAQDTMHKSTSVCSKIPLDQNEAIEFTTSTWPPTQTLQVPRIDGIDRSAAESGGPCAGGRLSQRSSPSSARAKPTTAMDTKSRR